MSHRAGAASIRMDGAAYVLALGDVWAVLIILCCVITPVIIVAESMPDFEGALARAPE